jgi:hypothetical protein
MLSTLSTFDIPTTTILGPVVLAIILALVTNMFFRKSDFQPKGKVSVDIHIFDRDNLSKPCVALLYYWW